MIKAIVFDFDGTLIDSVDSVWREYKRVSELMKLPEKTFEEFARQLGKPWTVALEALWPGVDVEEFSKHYRMNREKARLIDGVKETLEILGKDYTLAIMTARGEKTLNMHLDSTGIGHRDFKVILHRDSLRSNKPDPEALYHVCEEIEVETSEAVYVGDALVDAECAMKANVKFIGVLTGGATKEEFMNDGVGEDWIVESIKDVPSKLKAI